MSGFIIRGPGPTSGGGIQAGVRVRDDATLDLSYTGIRDIQDNPFSGCQNGEGIRVGPRGTDGAGPGHLTADNVAVTHYPTGTRRARPCGNARAAGDTPASRRSSGKLMSNAALIASDISKTLRQEARARWRRPHAAPR